MKGLKVIIWIFALFMGVSAKADDAKKLFDNREYLKAARLYNAGAKDAIMASEYSTYLENTLYEGECYYALNLTSDLKKSLDTIEIAYANYGDKVEDVQQRLLIEEGIYKLKGSYYTLLFTTNNTHFEQAISTFQKAESIIDKLYKETTFDDASLRVILYRDEINLYYAAHDYAKSLALCDVICDYYANLGVSGTSNYDFDKVNYRLYVDAFRSRAIIKARLNDFDGAITDITQIEGYKSQPILLRTIGKILMMEYDSTGKDTRSEAKRYYSKYISYIKKYIAVNLQSMTEIQREQYWLSMHDFVFDCYRLEDYAPEMLYDLALFSKGYLTNKNLHYRWQDVRNKLSSDACAIEFVQYNGKDDTKQIGALIINSNSSRPKFIHITDVDAFEDLKLKSGTRVGDAISQDRPTWKDELYNDNHLGSKIWTDELMSYIGEAKKVYFAPDGLLHTLAIEYIMSDSQKECHRLSSTRTIINPPKKDVSKILVCGDINFATAINDNTRIDNDVTAYKTLANSGCYFKNLPGTATEIDSISEKLECYSKGKITTVLRGSDASDTQFCKKANEADIVHISTHGFFTGTIHSTDLSPAITDNSLSESGLAMAGVNANLHNNAFDATHYDGILTAKELSEQNFSNIKMIVLSACQTGLGYITGDGVYGLQRGLKAAGVGAMTLSLWSVDDYATCELMQRFYAELLKPGATDIYHSFMQARKSLMTDKAITSYKFSAAKLALKANNLNFNKPQYTNAFILIDVL
jgi:hypothetical protein